MCNVNPIQKKRVGGEIGVSTKWESTHEFYFWKRLFTKSPPPFQKLPYEKIFDDPGELFRPSVCCKDMGTDYFSQR